MGWAGQFFRPLRRKPLGTWTPFPGSGGSRKGVAPANMHWDIFLACSTKEGIDAQTYVLLDTVIDLDGLYDLLEMKQVADSWGDAAKWNADTTGGVARG